MYIHTSSYPYINTLIYRHSWLKLLFHEILIIEKHGDSRSWRFLQRIPVVQYTDLGDGFKHVLLFIPTWLGCCWRWHYTFYIFLLWQITIFLLRISIWETKLTQKWLDLHIITNLGIWKYSWKHVESNATMYIWNRPTYLLGKPITFQDLPMVPWYVTVSLDSKPAFCTMILWDV